ncbi:MAG: cell filamentation protein Fic [Bacteroidales bacterium 45-6]|mgnify:CR=1 FL=1|nr:MAG: cell filamentation protein Fic [Bacteroidales bacterium 45-6]
MPETRQIGIINFIQNNANCSSSEIHKEFEASISYATVKRILTQLLTEKFIISEGKGKGTRYYISPSYELLYSIDLNSYYEKEIDERQIKEEFNLEIFDLLGRVEILNETELEKLSDLQQKYTENISQLSEFEYRKELERLAIDLSWKSSQIEGNTYSLLETERLLKDKETAAGKTKEEAIMLLNHKDAIDFIVENPDYLIPLKVSKIEDIHSILIKELAVDKNLRKRRVGISGTNYRPLDNEFQIREALEAACKLVNKKENIFEKVFLILVLISYIQPFMDGNMRTARIVSNAILMNYKHCPISFRTIDSVDYKKAMLLFYEQNNLLRFKEIFINQFDFAVKTYF